jgi:hypothetical protein
VEPIVDHPEDLVQIDWVAATTGNPMAGVARSTILATGAASIEDPRCRQLHKKRLHDLYLERYFELHPGGHDE